MCPRQGSLANDSLNTQMCGLCVIPPESLPESQVAPSQTSPPVVSDRDTTNANISKMFGGAARVPSKAVPTSAPGIQGSVSVSASGAFVNAAGPGFALPKQESMVKAAAPLPSHALAPAPTGAGPAKASQPSPSRASAIGPSGISGAAHAPGLAGCPGAPPPKAPLPATGPTSNPGAPPSNALLPATGPTGNPASSTGPSSGGGAAPAQPAVDSDQALEVWCCVSLDCA